MHTATRKQELEKYTHTQHPSIRPSQPTSQQSPDYPSLPIVNGVEDIRSNENTTMSDWR